MANFIMLLAVSSILKKALTHFLAQQKLIVIEKKEQHKKQIQLHSLQTTKTKVGGVERQSKKRKRPPATGSIINESVLKKNNVK